MRKLFTFIWAMTVLSISIRGILDVIRIRQSLKWLRKAANSLNNENLPSAHVPHIAIFIPVLRE